MSTKADQQAAAVTRDQWNHYLSQFGELEEDVINTLGSTKLVDQAYEDAATQKAIGEATMDRTVSRYGMNLTGVQKDQLNRRRALGDATTTAHAVNTARIDQRERNLGMAAEMMQQGRGVSSQAINGLGQAASLESNRNATNANLKAQSKAQTMSTVSTLAGFALMAF